MPVYDPEESERYLVCSTRGGQMKAAVKLRLDGLARALRAKAHALADDVEHSYFPDLRPAAPEAAPTALIERPKASRELADDRSGR
jgi:hypothetical protein